MLAVSSLAVLLAVLAVSAAALQMSAPPVRTRFKPSLLLTFQVTELTPEVVEDQAPLEASALKLPAHTADAVLLASEDDADMKEGAATSQKLDSLNNYSQAQGTASKRRCRTKCEIDSEFNGMETLVAFLGYVAVLVREKMPFGDRL